MADSPPRPGTGSEADHGSPPAVPRWVKVCAIVAGVLLLLAVLALLTGLGGQHGPDRHAGAGDPAPVGAAQIQVSSADGAHRAAPTVGALR